MKKVGVLIECEQVENQLIRKKNNSTFGEIESVKKVKRAVLEMILMIRQPGVELYGLLIYREGEAEEIQRRIREELGQVGIKKIILIYLGSKLSQNYIPYHVYGFSEMMNVFEITAFVGLSLGRNKTILPFLAAELNVPLAMRCRSVDLKNQVVEKPFYGEKFLAKLKMKGAVVVYGMSSVSLEMELKDLMSDEIVEPEVIHHKVKFNDNMIKMKYRFKKIKKSESQGNLKNLTEAEIVLAGGRAMGNKENFNLLYDCAKEMDAAVGASRVAVDQHWVSYSQQIGQTGFKISPKVYIGCGISGSIQHVLGMKTSKTVVAVNIDPKAALVVASDYYLNADLFQIIPLLTEKLKKRKLQKP